MLSLMLLVQPSLGRIGEFLHSLAMKMDGFGLMLVAIADSSFLSLPEGSLGSMISHQVMHPIAPGIETDRGQASLNLRIKGI